MRRFLVKLVGLVILVILGVSSSFAQDYFGGAQWIGAITRQQAHIPLIFLKGDTIKVPY